MYINPKNMRKKSTDTDIILIGGSAGSLQVILEMIKKLDENLGIPIVLVVHRKAYSTSILPVLLQQFSPIEVMEVEDKTELRNNVFYVAPSDYHVLFDDEKTMSLDSSEKMNYSRPSIDVSFQSAAEIFGHRMVGILLSGANADGVEGLKYIRKKKGRVWIQEPETAEVDYMPKQALLETGFDLMITPENLASHINQLY